MLKPSIFNLEQNDMMIFKLTDLLTIIIIGGQKETLPDSF